MKLVNSLLPLAAISTALVIPDDQFTSFPALESKEKSLHKEQCGRTLWEEFLKSSKEVLHSSKDAFDQAFDYTSEAGKDVVNAFEETFDNESFLDLDDDEIEEVDDFDFGHRPPHHKPPHHRKPKKPGHGKPNMTIYQILSGEKHTKKLTALIDKFDDLVELLNGTAANYTIFAPIDKAFDKLPKGHEPSKEFLKSILFYHVSPEFYPVGRIFSSRTIPTLYKSPGLGDRPQRLSTSLSLLKGLTINFYSSVIVGNVLGTNGVIHGINALLFPFPKAVETLDMFPAQFSTLGLALEKTGLYAELNDTSSHTGGTLFAPTNSAFKKLGPRLNAFLFSKFGEKYLKALIKYHVVPNHTLYSDAYYKPDSTVQSIPEGVFHVDLPTLLDDKPLSIDVARWGRFIEMKINAFSKVAVSDGVVADGVVHIPSNVIIPPKSVNGMLEHYQGEELTEEDLMERLEPYVDLTEL